MRNRFVNSARNVWDRAVTLLPRIDQFWYKYAYMEEMLGNVEGARKIFERWIAHKPDANAWNSFVKFEMRHDNIEHARDVFERLVFISARRPTNAQVEIMTDGSWPITTQQPT